MQAAYRETRCEWLRQNAAPLPHSVRPFPSRSNRRMEHRLNPVHARFETPAHAKNPSAVRSPVVNARSTGSTSLVMSFAALASVRAIRIVGTPTRRPPDARPADGGPHVGWESAPCRPSGRISFPKLSWSSKCIPAAPAAINDFISSKTLSAPPKPASASATIGKYQWLPRALRATLSGRPSERVIDPCDQGRNAIDRVEALIRIHFARNVCIGGNLPAAAVKCFNPARAACTAWLPVSAPSAVAVGPEHLPQPLRPHAASVCSTTTLPCSRTTSSAL